MRRSSIYRDGTSQSPSRTRNRRVDLLRRPRPPCGPANTAGPQWLDASRGEATADYAPSLRSPWRAANVKVVLHETVCRDHDESGGQPGDFDTHRAQQIVATQRPPDHPRRAGQHGEPERNAENDDIGANEKKRSGQGRRSEPAS